MRKRTLVTIALSLLVVGSLTYGWWFLRTSYSPLCQVYFVPIGGVPDNLIQKLIDSYSRNLDLRIKVLPALPITAEMLDPTRRQLVGETVIQRMRQRWPQLSEDYSVMLLGVTGGDMYIHLMPWRFAFAYREEGRFAVVSAARMDPTAFGMPRNDDVLAVRMMKVISKQIGIYYYRLPERHENTSVMYSPILGLDDLDAVGPDFDVVDRRRMAKIWRSCSQA